MSFFGGVAGAIAGAGGGFGRAIADVQERKRLERAAFEEEQFRRDQLSQKERELAQTQIWRTSEREAGDTHDIDMLGRRADIDSASQDRLLGHQTDMQQRDIGANTEAATARFGRDVSLVEMRGDQARQTYEAGAGVNQAMDIEGEEREQERQYLLDLGRQTLQEYGGDFKTAQARIMADTVGSSEKRAELIQAVTAAHQENVQRMNSVNAGLTSQFAGMSGVEASLLGQGGQDMRNRALTTGQPLAGPPSFQGEPGPLPIGAQTMLQNSAPQQMGLGALPPQGALPQMPAMQPRVPPLDINQAPVAGFQQKIQEELYRRRRGGNTPQLPPR